MNGLKKGHLRSRRAVLLTALLLILLTGCDSTIVQTLIPPLPTIDLGQSLRETQQPTPEATPPLPTPTNSATATVTVPSGPQTLTVWVPPFFNPANETPASQLFRQRLLDFGELHPEIEIRVRVKALSGDGGLLESLSAASAAAPNALPALVALPRSDLETGALKGLVYPLDGHTDLKTNPDWYDYAREMALIQDSVFGLPFGGDALVLMYMPEKVGGAPESWERVLSLGQPVVLPAADNQALVTLALYESAGGAVEDSQGRPVIDPQVLSRILRLYADGARQGSFPAWLTQYTTEAQAWQAYREGRGALLVGWSSRYLAELPVDSAAVPLPPLLDEDFTLASGWVWAMSDPSAERHAIAAQLAEYLVESEYMAQWTAAAGYIPPRPTALSAWQNGGLKTLFSRIALSAHIRPSNDLLASLGPALQESVEEVISNQGDPILAAEAAAEKVNSE